MASYPSNRELLIRLSETGNIIFESSSLSNTMSLVCKYIKSEPNKLIDSTILRDVSFINLDNANVNIDDLFEYKRKNSFGIVYNIFDSLDTLHALAFNNCPTLYSCIIPKGIKKLEEGIFYGCNSLKYISLPETIEEVCENVFNGCANLKSINNTEKITHLHQYAFAGCGIKSIKLSSTISSLLPYLFKNCYNLEKFESNSVGYLGEGVFSGCINLESININYQGITEANEEDYKEPLTEPEEPSPEPDPGSGDEPVPLTKYILLSPERYQIKQYDLTITEDYNEANRIIKSRAVTIQDGEDESFKYLLLRENWVTYHIYDETKSTQLYTTNSYEDIVSLGEGMINTGNIFFKSNNILIKFIKSPDDKYDFHHAVAYKVKYEVYDENDKIIYYIAPKYARERLEITQEDNSPDKFFHKTDINGDNILQKYVDKNLKTEMINKFRLSSTGVPEYEYINLSTGETSYFILGAEIPEGYEPVKTEGYPVYSDNFSRFGHSFESGGNTYSFTRLSTDIAVDLLRQYTLEEDIFLYPLNNYNEEELGIELTDNDMLDDYVYYTALDDEPVPGGGESGEDEGDDDSGKDAEDDIDGNITGCNALPDMIFANCRKLTHDSISFIDNIQEIGYGSMMGCSSLDHFDRMVTKIGPYGFKDCINLRNIKLNKCTEIKKYAFKNCISLQEVNLHDLDPELSIGVFEDCESLRKVGYNSIDIIGEKSFKNCINLNDYYNLKNIIRVENQGFYNCKKLTVTEENNLNNINYIGEFGFCKCESLNNVILNDNVIIGNGAFKDCKGLTHIELPSSITKLPNQTFNNCDLLETIEFKSDSLSSDFNMDAFDGCNNIKKIIIKEGNTYFSSINDEAVFDKQTKKLIYIAKNISKFEFTQELENCTIDPQAFNNCHLTLIDMSGIDAPTIEKNVFNEIDNNQWFIFMKENDPNYKKYVRIVGGSHIKVCKQ